MLANNVHPEPSLLSNLSQRKNSCTLRVHNFKWGQT